MEGLEPLRVVVFVRAGAEDVVVSFEKKKKMSMKSCCWMAQEVLGMPWLLRVNELAPAFPMCLLACEADMCWRRGCWKFGKADVNVDVKESVKI